MAMSSVNPSRQADGNGASAGSVVDLSGDVAVGADAGRGAGSGTTGRLTRANAGKVPASRTMAVTALARAQGRRR